MLVTGGLLLLDQDVAFDQEQYKDDAEEIPESERPKEPYEPNFKTWPHL